MITAGIDIGARTAKAVILADGEEPVYAVRPVDDVVSRLSRNLFKSVLKKTGIRRGKLFGIGVTGYGHKQIRFADAWFPSPLCLAEAAHHLDQTIRTVIDVGGLITRVVQVNDGGGVADYIENEKCASGSGRFLEMIADALELPVDRIGPESLTAGHPLRLSSQCVVFAESEVISHVNADEAAADILAGLHRSIAERVFSLARKTSFQAPAAIVGGVAKNSGVMHFLEQILPGEIKALPVDPQIVGALGAALLARKSGDSRSA